MSDETLHPEGEDTSLASLVEDLVDLKLALEQLNSALDQLRSALRQPTVRLQLALEAGEPQLSAREVGLN